MISNSDIQAELCALKDRAYANQLDTFSVLVDLIELLNCIHCDHEMEITTHVGDPTAEPPEVVQTCRKCGYQTS